MTPPFRYSPSGRDQGVALIIVLAFVVLLTGLIVAYFSRSMTDRQLSNSSFNQTKVDALAKSAVDVIVGDLKQEIVNGSTVTTTSSVSIYSPTSVANMLPMRSGNPPLVSGTDPIPNLVRISNHNDPTAPPLVSSRASNLVSTGTSANGRSISLARWNTHFLIPRVAGATATQTTPVASFTAPDWVFVTNQGPQTIGAPNTNVLGRYAFAVYDEGGLLDVNVAGYPSPSTASQSGAKGVLAYADLKQVGLTQGFVDDLTGWRNYASMQPNGAFGSFTALTASNAANFFNLVTANKTGFLKVNTSLWNNRTDQMFLSRQELLQYCSSAGVTSSAVSNALQYLGTFSRELNAPSWGPTQNAEDLGGNASYPYKDNRDAPTSINRFVPGVRFATGGTITSYRVDGSSFTYPVKAGEPLIQRRFPLGRLNWIGPGGPQNGGTAANIQACFGLKWDSTRGIWQYVGATGATEQADIKKLSDIAAEATVREPNFFELLQAGILAGSLALETHLSAGAAYNTHNYYTFHEGRLPLHVFRIGASILSQYEATNYPIVVEYNDTYAYPNPRPLPANFKASMPWQACGVDNLPYLNMFTALAGKDTTDASGSSLWYYLLFGVWNPHQTTSSSPMPKVRLHVKGTITVGNFYGDYASPVYAYGIAYPGYVATIDDTIELSNAGLTTADPHALLPGDVTPALGDGDSNGMAWTKLPSPGINGTVYAGYRLPNFKINMTKTPASQPPATEIQVWSSVWLWTNTDLLHPFNFWLEYQDPAGRWIPYNYHAGINDPATWITKSPGFASEYVGPVMYPSAAPVPVPPNPLQPIDPPSAFPPTVLGSTIFYFIKQHWETVDPRSLRFHHSQLQSAAGIPAWSAFLRGSIWSEKTDFTDPAAATYGYKGAQNIQAYFGPSGVGGTQWHPATLSRNNTPPPGWGGVSPSYNAPTAAAYTDPDGVQRIADSGLFTATPANGNGWQGDPYALSTTRKKDRPIILNRPFTSVGEMGYVARDYAWRTLDFFSPESADAGLLDLFTVAQTDSAVVAGRVNLNSRNSAVLNAVLCGGTKVDQPQTTISTAESKSIADAIVASTTSHPLINRAGLVANFRSPSDADARFTTLPTLPLSGTEDNQAKPQRESIIRALADVGQTRTWNLLIDVIAQAGRYPPNATSLAQFVVEGERRFWLHVAIDRFTGEVIDQQLEPVLE